MPRGWRLDVRIRDKLMASRRGRLWQYADSMNLRPGARLSSYEILEHLGSGGMGDVYRARDSVLGREVALKVLPAEFSADHTRLARFQQEARLASSLNHPNIVTIYGVGTDNDISYIAMELVAGKTVAQLLEEGPLTLEKTLDIASQVAEGLAKAHAAGVVHRDLKPQNIMINEDGLAKILDFGLSKAVVGQEHFSTMATLIDDATSPGTIMGTARYMSPEQASGKPIDFRSDHFSFGSVLYEMLSGRPPFERATVVQILSSIIEADPVPISQINSGVSPAVEAIVEKCMAKDPNGRYGSTADLQAQIESLRTNPSYLSPGVGLRIDRISRRHWKAAVLTLLALLAVFALIFFRHGASGDLRVESIPAVKKVAILPFTSVDSDPGSQAFLDGFAETLSSKLGELEKFQTGFRVIPSSDVRRQGITTPQAARQAFSATLVLRGVVQRGPESIKLTLHVIDPKEAQELRTRSIDVRLSDARALQDGLLVQVAEMLELEIKPEARKVLSAGATSASSAYEYYIQGRGYLQRYEKLENIDRATAAFQEALKRDPRYALAFAGLCEASLRKYDLRKETNLVDEARAECMHAVEFGADVSAVHVTSAMLDTATGRYDDAVKDARSAINLDNTKTDAYLELARAYQEMGKTAEAEATYKKVIEVRPDDYAAYSNLGAFYYRTGRYSDAASQFREVTRLTPDNSRAYANLGGIYVLLKRNDDAIEMLQKSLDLQPTSLAYNNLGTIYYKMGRYEDAARNYEQAIKLKEEDYQLWRNLGEAYSWLPAQIDKSISAYKRSIELGEKQLKVNPKDALLLKDLAEGYANLKDRQQAIDYIQRALSLKPQDLDVIVSAIGVYEVLGEREKALQSVRQGFSNGMDRDALDSTPGMASLRADPRFQALRER